MGKRGFQKYRQRLRKAIEERRGLSKPHSLMLPLAVCGAVFTFLCLSIYLVPEGSRYSFHFYMESGAVTILNVTILLIASSFALLAGFTAPQKSGRALFLILFLGFLFLALDEVLMFHEHLGDWLDGTRFLKVIFRATAIRRWNDLIIILYGVAALPLLVFLLPTALRLPFVAEYLALAFLCYVAHTGVDALVEPPTTPSYIIEESFKVYTATFLALAAYAGWQNRQIHNDLKTGET